MKVFEFLNSRRVHKYDDIEMSFKGLSPAYDLVRKICREVPRENS